MLQAAVYARVSSDRQKEAQTIDSQIAAVLHYGQQHGYTIPPEWIFADEGYSGATLTRPALERLRDWVAEGAVERVLVYAPDRLSRRYAYQILLLEEFTRAGAEVEFVTTPPGGGPEQELLVQFQGMIAEYEKAQITERTRRGKVHRARVGSVNVLSGAPYGYRYIRHTEDLPARYEVIEEQAEVVRRMFDWYTQDGLSIGQIAVRLSREGIPTRTGKRRWDRSTVWGILRNPAYEGRACFRKTGVIDTPARVTRRLRLRGATVARHKPNRPRPREEWIAIPVPALVESDQFALAQERLQLNLRCAARRTKEPTLLQGLVVCQQCGYAYYRTSTRTARGKLYYYRCLGSDDYRWEHGRVCQNAPVRQDYLDTLVWEHVMALLKEPALIHQEIDRRQRIIREGHPTARQRDRIVAELTRVQRARSRLIEAYQEGFMDLAELRQRMPRVRQRELALREQLKTLEAHLAGAERYLQLQENLETFLERLRTAAETLSVPDRQRVLRLLVKHVEISTDKIVIKHSIPVPDGRSPAGYLLRGRSQ
jgi:site-specific DNA recombinase